MSPMVDVGDIMAKILEIFRRKSSGNSDHGVPGPFFWLRCSFSIANHQAANRSQEDNLLESARGQVHEMFVLCLSIRSAGTRRRVRGNDAVLRRRAPIIISVLFEGIWVFTWHIPSGLYFGVTAVAVRAANLATRRVLREKPIKLLLTDQLG